MDIRAFSDRLSPDLSKVLLRFPLAILFAVATTAVAIVDAHSLVVWPEEGWMRLIVGLATGAALALAGRLFIESRPAARLTGLVLAYVLPFVGLALCVVPAEGWVAWQLVPAAVLMWLSVSAFTRIGLGAERADIENRFWWLNQRAVVSGLIALAAAVIFALGLVALDRSLALLFGFSLWGFVAHWLLPIVFGLLAPVYWFAVLPRLEDCDAAALAEPDFLVRAVGFIGLFVLTPLLIAYGLILVVYAVEIAVTRTLPVGVFGWLVTTFVVTGAANWLVLHPGFIRDRLLARLYRRLWFWATLLPLVLLAVGLFVRIGAYGITPERLLLIAGFLWALALSLVYCWPGRHGDIRLMPALAGLAFLGLAVGPWNIEAAPIADQAARFDAALVAAGTSEAPNWTPERAAAASSALGYLMSAEAGIRRVDDILARHGRALGADRSAVAVAALIGLPADTTRSLLSEHWSRPPFVADPVAGTPYLIGEITADAGASSEQGGLVLSLLGNRFIVTGTPPAEGRVEVDLGAWLGRQGAAETLTEPAIDFRLGERQYRLIARYVQIGHSSPEAPPQVVVLSGLLFTDRP